MEKRRILKIVSGFDDGGVFTCEYNFISNLREKGFLVDLVIVGRGNRLKDYQRVADKHILLGELQSNLGGGLVKIIKEILKIRKYGDLNFRKVTEAFSGPYYAVLYRRPMFMYLVARLSDVYRCRAYWHTPNPVTSTFAKLFYTVFSYRYKTIPIANSIFTKKTLGNICKYVVYPGYSKGRVVSKTVNFRKELNI